MTITIKSVSINTNRDGNPNESIEGVIKRAKIRYNIPGRRDNSTIFKNEYCSIPSVIFFNSKLYIRFLKFRVNINI